MVLLMKRTLSFIHSQGIIWSAVSLLVVLIVQCSTGEGSWTEIEQNVGKSLLPTVGFVGVVAAYLIVRAAIDLSKELNVQRNSQTPTLFTAQGLPANSKHRGSTVIPVILVATVFFVPVLTVEIATFYWAYPPVPKITLWIANPTVPSWANRGHEKDVSPPHRRLLDTEQMPQLHLYKPYEFFPPHEGETEKVNVFWENLGPATVRLSMRARVTLALSKTSAPIPSSSWVENEEAAWNSFAKAEPKGPVNYNMTTPPGKSYVTVESALLTEEMAREISNASGRAQVFITGRFKWIEPNGKTHGYEFCAFTIGNFNAVFNCQKHNGPTT